MLYALASLLASLSCLPAIGVAVAEVNERQEDFPRPAESRILYIVYSDSDFYTTRLKWLADTWGSNLPSTALTVVGDQPFLDPSFRFEVHNSSCKAHSHIWGACCKYATAIQIAHRLLREQSTFAFPYEWVYFLDDDSYVRTAKLEDALASRNHTEAMVLGNYGCGTARCQGLCGGGGYIASRKAVELLATGGPDGISLTDEEMDACDRCDGWADVALSQLFNAREITHHALPGLYGWQLEKSCFDESLAVADRFEPLMYHYIRSRSAMNFLHELFSPRTQGNAWGRFVGWAKHRKSDDNENCAKYDTTVQCLETDESISEFPLWVPTDQPTCRNVFDYDAASFIALSLGSTPLAHRNASVGALSASLIEAGDPDRAVNAPPYLPSLVELGAPPALLERFQKPQASKSMVLHDSSTVISLQQDAVRAKAGGVAILRRETQTTDRV